MYLSQHYLNYLNAEGLLNMTQLVEEKLPSREVFFIYGTLKGGHRNHDLLIPSQAMLLNAMAVGKDLILTEVYRGTPGAVSQAGYNISGEVWELSGKNVTIIDRLERGYTKATIRVQTTNGDIYCSTYLWQQPCKAFLPHGHWSLDLEKLSMEKGL